MAKLPAKQAKRRLKNPETFREKSLKVTENSQKTSTSHLLKSKAKPLFVVIFKPVKSVFVRLNKIQPFKFIFKILRVLGLVLVPTYLRTSLVELKEVTWPNRLKSRQLTTAVLIFAVAFGIVVAIVDYGLDKLFRNILLK